MQLEKAKTVLKTINNLKHELKELIPLHVMDRATLLKAKFFFAKMKCNSYKEVMKDLKTAESL